MKVTRIRPRIDDHAAAQAQIIEADEARRAALNLMEDAVTARQAASQLNEELKINEARYRTLTSILTDVPWTTSSSGEFITPQPAWMQYTGQSWEECRGFGWANALHPEDREKVQELWRNANATNSPYQSSGRFWHGATQTFRHFITRAVPVSNEDGSTREWVGACTDVTERRELEQRIAQQTEELADESRRKDEFLAMLSHELRNPLAPIRSAVHVLRLQARGKEDPLLLRPLEIIDRQVLNLTRLVSDLLEVSRVISGRIHLEQQTVDLNQVLHHAIETAKPSIDQRRHELAVKFCEGPVWVFADATRVEEIFTNLLNNAAKFTEDGGRIEIHCEPGAAASTVQVRVRDSGVGIEPKLLPRIFDLFTQADRSLARSAGGLGIGLALAHRLTTLHGGTIDATSPPPGADRGSEFIVTLPLVAAHEEVDASADTKTSYPVSPDTALKVLVVDDNIDQVTMLSSVLKNDGHLIRTAHTGPDALSQVQQWHPDVVLLDIGLPGLDGYEVARSVRADPDIRATRLIAISGYARDTDIARSREAGFDAHLAKPVDFPELTQLLTAPG